MMTVETKPCPCGKKMIKRYCDYVLLTYPAQHPWDWWCACGHTEEGGIERDMTAEEMVQQAWERANE